jgi:DNA-binding NarL/FixJ family response regulator
MMATDGVGIKVLLVDDQPLMRMGFAMVLGAEDGIDLVGEAADGRIAIEQVAALAPDVVLMDVRMPVMDGIEATSRIVATYPETKVILLTTFDLDEYAFAGLRAGASGFLLKDVRPAELVAAVKAVAAGDAVVSPRVTRRMLEIFAPELPAGLGATFGSRATLGSGTRAATGRGAGARADGIVADGCGTWDSGGTWDGGGSGAGGAGTGAEGTVAKKMADLTPKEREVFGQMAIGLTNLEIAAAMDISEATVKTHVGAVLKKLGLRDRVQAVIYAYQTGLVAPGEASG